MTRDNDQVCVGPSRSKSQLQPPGPVSIPLPEESPYDRAEFSLHTCRIEYEFDLDAASDKPCGRP